MANWSNELVLRLTFAHPVLAKANVRYVLAQQDDGAFVLNAEHADGRVEPIKPTNGGRWPDRETATTACEKHRQKILAGIAKALEEAK